MDAIVEHASGLRGSLTVPPDKAICHRAVLAASIAQGRTEMTPWPLADDCQRTLQVVRELGRDAVHAFAGDGIQCEIAALPESEIAHETARWHVPIPQIGLAEVRESYQIQSSSNRYFRMRFSNQSHRQYRRK